MYSAHLHYLLVKVYDFSPVRGETNWKKAGRMFKVGDCLDICTSITISTYL